MLDNLPAELYDLSTATIVFRVALAIFVGGIIGTERDYKSRAAGTRTHMLVCLGAAVVMMTNQYVVTSFPDLDLDITRMGAQVISGIGFLGAGTILVTSHNQVRGLTTAAGLWTAAALGLAIGIGFYEMAIIGSIAVLFIVIILRPLKRFVKDRADLSHFTLLVYTVNGIEEFLEYTSDEEVKLVNMSVENEPAPSDKSTGTIIKVTIELGPDANKDDFIVYLKSLDSITHVVEI